MLTTAGIRIYLSDSLTEPLIGAENGIITLTEAAHTLTVNYLSDILLEDWDSGCSSIVDVRTHPRPQVFSGGNIVIDNISGYYGKLEMYEANIKGAKIERVHFLDGSEETISVHYISSVKETSTAIELTLSGIPIAQDTLISTPVAGDVYHPVIFGAHEYGVYVPSETQFDVAQVVGVNAELVVYRVGSWINNTVKWGLFPYNYLFTPSEIYASYGGTGPNNLYLRFTSGTGAGDILRLTSDDPSFEQFDFDNTDRVVDCYTRRTFSDEVGDYNYSTINSEGNIFTTEVSRAELVTGSTVYTTDQSSYFVADTTDFTVYNAEKIGNSVDFNKDANTITLSSPTITNETITTVNALPAESVEIETGINPNDFGVTGTWTLDASGIWINNALTTVTKSGTEADTIDRSISTALEYELTLDAPFQAGVLILKTKLTSENLESLLIDSAVECVATSGEVGTIKNNVSFFSGGGNDTTWQSAFDYEEVITNEIDEIISGYAEVNAFQSDIHDSFYGNANTWNREYYSNTNFDFVSGASQNFAYDGKIRRALTPENVKGIENYIVIYFSGGYTVSNPTNSTTLVIRSIGGYYGGGGCKLSDTVYSSVNGRPYTTFSAAMQHIIKLRNWGISGVAQPASGWGLGEALVSITDNSLNTAPVRSQFKDLQQLKTAIQEERLMIESWDMIFFNNDDTPIIASIVDKLGESGATHSFVSPSQAIVTSIELFSDQDIFNVFNVEYDYDLPTKSYLKSINVFNTGKDTYDTSYVTGVTVPADAEQIWDDSHKLFEVCNAEKVLPKSRSQLRWIYSEADAVQYIKNCIKLYGIGRPEGSPLGVYFETRKVTATHKMQDYYDISIGDSIEYNIPNVTGVDNHSGVVLGKSYDADKKECSIISIIRGQIVSRSLIETGVADLTIIEEGNSIDNIIEVGV